MGDGDDGDQGPSGDDPMSPTGTADDKAEPPFDTQDSPDSGEQSGTDAAPPSSEEDSGTDADPSRGSSEPDPDGTTFPIDSREDEQQSTPRGPARPLGGRRQPGSTDKVPNPTDGLRPALAWLVSTNHGAVIFLREIVVSVLVVLSIGLLLFAVSGVWPPLVAVESGSMEPHLQKGDLVFVMEEHRLAPEYAVGETGVVTMDVAKEQDYTRFGDNGDVIVYRPFGVDDATPVIHRAHYFVEEDENWYQVVNSDFVQADSCEELRHCPAPYDGFITKGDNAVSNDYYDQARGISTPVKPEWVRGRAVVRVPWLGWVRLAASDMNLPGVSQAAGVIDGTVPKAALG